MQCCKSPPKIDAMAMLPPASNQARYAKPISCIPQRRMVPNESSAITDPVKRTYFGTEKYWMPNATSPIMSIVLGIDKMHQINVRKVRYLIRLREALTVGR